ncbi:chromobox protein homolog 5-like [Palaemon carinicauda]|uniref:chromobox protein homolog 5-like n=1 Tax=Palaemon carinicauda TaxID=392227 RepID=UPI0035B60F21
MVNKRSSTRENGEAAPPAPPPPPKVVNKDDDVGTEGDETTDDEGGVDTPPPATQAEDEKPEAVDEDGNYEVEQIVDMETKKKWKCPVKFRVRWVGYGEKDDSWLPASHLNCDDLINEFLEISGRTSEYKLNLIKEFLHISGRTSKFKLCNLIVKSKALGEQPGLNEIEI